VLPWEPSDFRYSRLCTHSQHDHCLRASAASAACRSLHSSTERNECRCVTCSQALAQTCPGSAFHLAYLSVALGTTFAPGGARPALLQRLAGEMAPQRPKYPVIGCRWTLPPAGVQQEEAEMGLRRWHIQPRSPPRGRRGRKSCSCFSCSGSGIGDLAFSMLHVAFVGVDSAI